ncbi:hypothetical protein [Flavobacterium sp.]|uniref:hypothetical protein n=1 Tax=Flavobacterium sp. TaxID=239 RepID=UPI00260F4CEB|nr:hypothetical protein [Flavobacterium sp.]
MKNIFFNLSKVKSSIFFLTFFFIVNNANSQNWLDKAKKTIKDVKNTAKEVNGTTKEVNKTVKSVKELKKTWTKDDSPNIKYKQIPDYRNKEEVKISKKQKLDVENGEFVNLSWEPVTKFDNQIFPSFIIGWATYKGEKNEDMGSSLGFKINTNLSNVVLKWEIESSDKSFFAIDSGYVNCDELKGSRNFMPKIAWNYRELTKNETSTPLNIYFRLVDPNTGKKVEKLVNVNLRSINDCMIKYNQNKYHYLFASYVNEDHPEIDKILKQMLDTKMIDAVLGYQWGEEYVDLQIAALWRVLHDRGFQYSSITDNSGYNESTGLFSQTVRSFDSSMKTNQANCVDGSIIFASVLKRIGIRPVLITVPGHCFLGYYTDDTPNASLRFIETTMMSNKNFITNPKSSIAKYKDVLAKTLPKNSKISDLNKAYYLEFLSAKVEGQNKYTINMEKYGKDYVNLLDINDLRQYIKPIPTFN